MNSEMIYLDYNSNAPIIDEALNDMNEAYIKIYGNPSSIHYMGRSLKSLIEESRITILKNIGIKDPHKSDYHLTFTASGTESNNLLLSNFHEYIILASSVEHLSISLHKNLASQMHFINVDKNGLLDLKHLENLLKKHQSNDKKILVSVMHANNETGVLQDIKEIFSISKSYGAFTHSDAVQSIGKIEFDINDYDVDFVTLSSHKLGGPLGIAALIHKKSFHLNAQQVGGGQEKSLRPGTENYPAIKGFSTAIKNAAKNVKTNFDKILKLRDYFENEIISKCPKIEILGKNVQRLPNTSNIIIPNVKSAIQLIYLDNEGIYVSSGSACSSGKVSKSHVLSAMGVEENKINNSIRISLGPENNINDIDILINKITEIYYKFNG